MSGDFVQPGAGHLTAQESTLTASPPRDGGEMHPYPLGAINRALNVLELSYSYLRDKPVTAQHIDEAIHYLRRANELYEEAGRDG